jgi:signal transduction histidine kinase
MSEDPRPVPQQAGEEDRGARRFTLQRSVFPRVAGVLVGVQVTTGLLAVALSAWMAYDRSLTLAANSLRLRLDGVAEEVEQRATFAGTPLSDLPVLLRSDLATRFPDPIRLLDAQGQVLRTLYPDATVFGPYTPAGDSLTLPDDVAVLLDSGQIVLQIDSERRTGSWGLAPVYDVDGLLAGGLLVHPLERSLNRELAGTQEAFRRAFVLVAAIAILTALLLGALVTDRMVRPLRRMTRRVERIGAGEYSARLPEGRDDEFGRLSAAINQMAAEVEHSIESLKATDRLRRELIANVGHDLRTPIAALQGYLEETGRFIATGAESRATEALQTAARQGQYLKRLVEDLFELSVLDSPHPPLRREPIPLAELLTDAASGHRTAFQKAGITFSLHLDAHLPVFEGDGVRLLRVLDNLLGNARNYTPEGHTVQLSATVEASRIVVRVQDSGIGMAPDVLENIFERYYRGTDARTRTKGTGLGLPISRAIARAHGGDLTAESTPGQGSTFTLWLPVAESMKNPGQV